MIRVRITEDDKVLMEQDGGSRLTIVGVVNEPMDGEISCGIAMHGTVDPAGLYAVFAAIYEHAHDTRLMMQALDMLTRYIEDKAKGALPNAKG